LNTFEVIDALSAASFKEDPLKADFWGQSDVPFSVNTYWTDAAREGGGPDIHDPQFGQYWIKYRRLHFGLYTDCDSEEDCNCMGHNCVRAQSTVGYAAAAATTAKSIQIRLVDVVPLTLTSSEIDLYKWHW